jgi:CheY-like chemotaxis protein/signal transduction histidine kinase
MNNPFTQRAEPLLHGLIAVLLVATFVADLLLPLGIAIWVIYLLPTALAYFLWRPTVPLLVALVSTLMVIIGFFLSRAGVDPDVARANRALGVLTAWIVAATGYFFIRSKLEVRRQEWLQAGQVGLSRRMIGEQRLDQLGESVLGFLADYLGAQAAAMFIQNGSGFRRRATLGVPADAPVPTEIQPDDGLVGQAIHDQRQIRLDEVPEGYLYFGSGLGRGRPRQLLIAPTVADGSVNAVLEFGFAARRDARASELLERVAESIAIAVRSAKYRVQLQELLQETQSQEEELQAQSEELRAANAELEEQSQSLQRQQAELEQTNVQLEQQTDELTAQRDDLGRAQTALEVQARELEQASRYKSEFLANMSHELRTPLNSLLILARLLVDNRGGRLDAEQVRYAQTIESAGNDLLTLINDILDISKIEAGRLDLTIASIGIASLFDKLRSAFATTAAQKGLSLRIEISPGLPPLESDAQRLEQVLKNFLSNAMKFTDRGEIALTALPRGEKLALTVRDTGIGIPAEQQQVIFEAFRQADGTINRKYGGTGLGLSISRELARLLGAEIEVESASGQGSAFTLLIPHKYDAGAIRPASNSVSTLAPPDAVTPGPPTPLPPRRRQFEDDRGRLDGAARVILVVEDDPAFARILYDLARELEFQCLVAESADEGVVLVRQYLPNAVILDIGLPDHTGLSVLDRIKRDTRTRHIPVHVVSVADYTLTALSFGAIGYMLKPVKREELVTALERLEARLSQRVRRLLLVEDDPVQLDSLGILLGSRDVDTIGVRTAAACFEQLGKQTFDCIVLDLNLPDASGFEILEMLSRSERFSFPPVIIYTGKELTADEELALRRYSKSIIIKGAKSPERLLDEVTLFLHQVVAELPAEQQLLLAKSLNRDAALEGRRILVVEDDVRNVFALTSIFEPHGATVEIARNGREALTALERAGHSGRPIDLVLMDVMMPEMDGLTATREIRNRPDWKGLPVIALTAKAMPDDQEQCLAAGANDYLAKPLDVDKLLSLVRVWMPR